MRFITRLLLNLYFIPAKFVLAITILLLILDFAFARICDGYSSPIVKSEGIRGVLFILLTSYFAWPYYLWVVFKHKK